MITGLHHINITIPPSSTSLTQAEYFYSQTLGLTPREVPAAQKDRLAWFDIGSESNQQVHVAFGREPQDFTQTARTASRHACFRVSDLDALRTLQQRIWDHFQDGPGQDTASRDEDRHEGRHEGGDDIDHGATKKEVITPGKEKEEKGKEQLLVVRKKSAPLECDRPGEKSSGAQGPEYPTRFFARDFAGNRLEFSI